MTIIINHTNKSGHAPETLHNVKSYKDTSLWSVEVTFNDESTDSFYGVESVTELSNTRITTSELKSIQENILLIKEIAIEMLNSSDRNMVQLSNVLSDRCLDIELELCNQEPEVGNAKDALIYGSYITFDELIKDEDIDYSSWTAYDWTHFWQNKIISEGKK